MPDSLEIYLSPSLTPAQRELAEQSIASMVEGARATIDAARARLAEEEKLRAAAMAPLARMMQADPEAAAAIEKLGMRQVEAEASLPQDGSPVGARDLVVPVSPTDRSVDLRLAPYDFAWRWHDAGGAPPFFQAGERDGRLTADARVGDGLPGAANRHVAAHIGVGSVVRIERPMGIHLFATRDSRHSFAIGSRGIGASATSEGGLNTTFMRGGQVLLGGAFPLWHRRVSGFEDARDGTNFTRSVYPDGMGGRIDPGEYGYNAGIWAFADFSLGVAGTGAAGGQSVTQSTILDMRIHRLG